MQAQNGSIVVDNKLLFLEPRNRILQSLGVETKCSIHFRSHFNLNNGKFLIYTKNELIHSMNNLSPLSIDLSKSLSIFENDDFNKHSLYNYDMISAWNDIISASTQKETLSSVVARNIDNNKASIPGEKSFFQYFQDSSLFLSSLNSMIKDMGSYSAFAFTLVAVCAMAYNFLMFILVFKYIRGSTTSRETITYMFSPINYLLRRDKKGVYLYKHLETGSFIRIDQNLQSLSKSSNVCHSNVMPKHFEPYLINTV